MSPAPSRPNVTAYRYGQSSGAAGLAIGVTRHLPRGIKKPDYARKGYFDVWFPIVAPSPGLVHAYQQGEISWAGFERRYRAEMKVPAAKHAIELLAAMAERHPLSLGCFCADESHCHRSLLKRLVEEAAADLPRRPSAAARHRVYASPACSMPEIEE